MIDLSKYTFLKKIEDDEYLFKKPKFGLDPSVPYFNFTREEYKLIIIDGGKNCYLSATGVLYYKSPLNIVTLEFYVRYIRARSFTDINGAIVNQYALSYPFLVNNFNIKDLANLIKKINKFFRKEIKPLKIKIEEILKCDYVLRMSFDGRIDLNDYIK